VRATSYKAGRAQIIIRDSTRLNRRVESLRHIHDHLISAKELSMFSTLHTQLQFHASPRATRCYTHECPNGPVMVRPKYTSRRISERWKLWSVVTCLMSATGSFVAASLDAAAAQERAVPKQDIILGSDARTGKSLFEKHCVLCHGPRGRGDGLEIAGANVADLSSPATQRKLNVELLRTIHDGRPGKVMPSWTLRLSDKQAHDVLAYIRTLKK